MNGWPSALRTLEGQRVLVTGGTGSLGKPLVERILEGQIGKPHSVTVFSRDEGKHHAMRAHFENLRSTMPSNELYANFERYLRFHLGDVRDYESLLSAARNADVIFHVAALKQVPSCEYFPEEAVRTNILGAQNLVRAIKSGQTDVRNVIGVSTDKAVKPVNVMGMSKAIQERILIGGNVGQEHTDFRCVRYGNVVSSRGSVVPYFIDQIASGGPVTITAPEMTRFLLTLGQAVDTVFDCLIRGFRGETFIPQIPAARITDVAAALIDGRDIDVKEVGIRPGEKVHEILISEEEVARTRQSYGTLRKRYYVIEPILPELQPEPQYPSVAASPTEEYSSATSVMDPPAVKELLTFAGYFGD